MTLRADALHRRFGHVAPEPDDNDACQRLQPLVRSPGARTRESSDADDDAAH